MSAALILASGSAIRAELLRRAGLAFEVRTADIDERALEAGWAERGLDAAATAEALAAAKALAVSRQEPDAVVIGADQTLALGTERFDKARDRAEAQARLHAMQGRAHQLHSAFALTRGDKLVATGLSSATLVMRALDEAAIGRYLDRTMPDVLSSVGCYQLEGIGVTLFDSIEGDYFTILGLPLLALLRELRAIGFTDAST